MNKKLLTKNYILIICLFLLLVCCVYLVFNINILCSIVISKKINFILSVIFLIFIIFLKFINIKNIKKILYLIITTMLIISIILTWLLFYIKSSQISEIYINNFLGFKLTKIEWRFEELEKIFDEHINILNKILEFSKEERNEINKILKESHNPESLKENIEKKIIDIVNERENTWFQSITQNMTSILIVSGLSLSVIIAKPFIEVFINYVFPVVYTEISIEEIKWIESPEFFNNLDPRLAMMTLFAKINTIIKDQVILVKEIANAQEILKHIILIEGDELTRLDQMQFGGEIGDYIENLEYMNSLNYVVCNSLQEDITKISKRLII